jgi:hypothetical protein
MATKIYEDKRKALDKARRQAWNKELVKVDAEIPPELYKKIEALAKEAGISTSQAFSIILTEQVKIWQEQEERIKKIIKDAFDEEYNRIAAPLELEVKRLEEFNRVMLELFPHIKSKLQKKTHN